MTWLYLRTNPDFTEFQSQAVGFIQDKADEYYPNAREVWIPGSWVDEIWNTYKQSHDVSDWQYQAQMLRLVTRGCLKFKTTPYPMYSPVKL